MENFKKHINTEGKVMGSVWSVTWNKGLFKEAQRSVYKSMPLPICYIEEKVVYVMQKNVEEMEIYILSKNKKKQDYE